MLTFLTTLGTNNPRHGTVPLTGKPLSRAPSPDASGSLPSPNASICRPDRAGPDAWRPILQGPTGTPPGTGQARSRSVEGAKLDLIVMLAGVQRVEVRDAIDAEDHGFAVRARTASAGPSASCRSALRRIVRWRARLVSGFRAGHSAGKHGRDLSGGRWATPIGSGSNFPN